MMVGAYCVVGRSYIALGVCVCVYGCVWRIYVGYMCMYMLQTVNTTISYALKLKARTDFRPILSLFPSLSLYFFPCSSFLTFTQGHNRARASRVCPCAPKCSSMKL